MKLQDNSRETFNEMYFCQLDLLVTLNIKLCIIINAHISIFIYVLSLKLMIYTCILTTLIYLFLYNTMLSRNHYLIFFLLFHVCPITCPCVYSFKRLQLAAALHLKCSRKFYLQNKTIFIVTGKTEMELSFLLHLKQLPSPFYSI